MHTLYLCYFWLNEPLVQTQVLPYLRELQKDGIKISLMTFEREMSENWSGEQIEEQHRKFAAEGIDWYPLAYHKSPSIPATLYDVYNGARLARRIIREKKVDVLHARVHVPAMMGAIAKTLSGSRVKLLFDIRGFMPEEYTDNGNWKKDGALYKTVKNAERRLMKNSDAFVVLTEKAREILFPESLESGFDKLGRPVEVIPCCVDLDKFAAADEASRAEIRQKLNLGGREVFVYIGSLGSWYLADEMAELLGAARKRNPKTFALILTKNSPDEIKPQLLENGFTEEDFYIGKVPHEEIPCYLSAADVAVSFIKACYSKQSSSPTKIAEYLASGLPIICNRGVGDVDSLIQTDKIGAIVDGFDAEDYEKALRTIGQLRESGGLSERCRASARNRFDLEKIGGVKYRNLYQRLKLKI